LSTSARKREIIIKNPKEKELKEEEIRLLLQQIGEGTKTKKEGKRLLVEGGMPWN
jgi:hypothetical protein